jgi:hypothetical protein
MHSKIFQRKKTEYIKNVFEGARITTNAERCIPINPQVMSPHSYNNKTAVTKTM